MPRQLLFGSVSGLSRAMLVLSAALIAGLILGGTCSLPSGDRPDHGNQDPISTDKPSVALHTNMGRIVIELFPEQAPDSVASLQQLALDEGYYDNAIFHESSSSGLELRAGVYNLDLDTLPEVPLFNESNNGLKNVRGRVALFGPEDTESGQAELLFSLGANTSRDFDAATGEHVPYTVIGRVIEGLDILDEIAELTTLTAETTDGDSLSRMPVTADRLQVRIIQSTYSSVRRIANTAPVADAGSEKVFADPGIEVTLDASGSTDPEDDPMAFAWELTQESLDALEAAELTIELDDANAVNPVFEAPEPEEPIEVTFQLTVTDDRGLSSTDTVVVDIATVANAPPTADAGANQTVTAGSTVALDGSASSDAEDDPFTYAWELSEDSQNVIAVAGYTVELNDPTIAQPTFEAPEAEEDLELTFELTVTDEDDRTSTDSVIITVTGNFPPTADAGDDLVAAYGDDVQLQGSGTDTDGTIVSYVWTQISGPTVTLSDSTIAAPSFTAPQESGVAKFRLTVTDDDGKTATSEMSVAVFAATPGDEEQARVRLTTSMGDIIIGLLADAPVTTANFLEYVNDGFYDGTIFHRVVPGFVVQGGGFEPDLVKKETRDTIANEFSEDRSNVRGTLAMAKVGGDPDSATSQFFFNLADNSENLDNQNGGFTVFARVVEGQDVVDEIAAVDTETREDSDGNEFEGVPVEDVIITSATVEWERSD